MISLMSGAGTDAPFSFCHAPSRQGRRVKESRLFRMRRRYRPRARLPPAERLALGGTRLVGGANSSAAGSIYTNG
jgi:hypothetical protein